MPTRVSVHAQGLLQPSHMEWTTDDRLLVSEFGGGRVLDITAGGDFRDAEPFAGGLRNPAGLTTTLDGNRILVADSGNSTIVEITDGGSFAEASPHADVPGVYGLVERDGTLLAAYATDQENGVTRADGAFSEDAVHFGGFPNGSPGQPASMVSPSQGCATNWNTLAFDETLLYVHAGLGSIYDVSKPGTFSASTPKFVTGLVKPLGMIYSPATDLLYVAERGTGSIKPVPREGGLNMRFVPPVATGFKEPSCIRISKDGATMYVCDMAECVVWRVEFGG